MTFIFEDAELRKILGAIAIFLLIMGLIAGVATIIPLARADGASSTEEVWVKFKSTWEGQEADADSEQSIEVPTCASKFNYSTWDFDILNITDVRAYARGSVDEGTRTYRIGFWNYTADGNAGDRFGYIEFDHSESLVYEWKDTTGATAVTVTDTVFFMGAWAASQAGTSVLAYSTNGGTLKSIDDTTGFADDPFVETNSHADRTYNIQFRGWGYKNTYTTHNLYYGNATHYVARRDLNYTFPTGSGQRQIRITYPVDEYVVNVTRSNGGAFDTILSSSDFTDASLNATHKLITIPEATIALYGGDYRTFTQSYNYLYTFYGLYYENGTSAGDVDVTVYFTDGTTTTINVNGTLIYGADETIDEISWEVPEPTGQDARPIAFYQSSGTVYLFTPEDTYGVYQFDINDYSGRVGQGECYLESYRAVNGTWRLVERRQFTGIYNDVPMLMVLYKIYKIQIRFSDGSIYDHGYFYPGVDLEPTIAITTIPFSDQAHTVYQYITAEATRPNATHIQLEYTDETPGYDTSAANMTITYRNGSQAYTTAVAGADSITFNWYGANNVTDYVVYLYLTHQLHGSIQQTWILDYSRIFESFPDLELFGDFGGLPTSNLWAITVGLVIAGACSFKSAAVAPFLFMCIQAIFTYLGGATYTNTQLGIGISLSIMLGLAIGDRHI